MRRQVDRRDGSSGAVHGGRRGGVRVEQVQQGVVEVRVVVGKQEDGDGEGEQESGNDGSRRRRRRGARSSVQVSIVETFGEGGDGA